MVKEDLIHKDLSKRKDHKELARKGGLSKSPRKTLTSRINGLLSSKSINNDTKYMLQLLRDNNLIELLSELISKNVEECDDKLIRNKTIDQLQKMLPTKVWTVSEKYNMDEPMTDSFMDELEEHFGEK